MSVVTWPSPFGYTIFCDDIRREIGGKNTFVGVYNAELIVNSKPPIVLARLALAITYHERFGEETKPVEIRVYFPGDADDNPRVKAALPADFRSAVPANEDTPQTDAMVSMTFYLNLSPVELNAAGVIRVRAYRGDDEIRLGSLRVKFNPAQE